jgi:hypothetical protein
MQTRREKRASKKHSQSKPIKDLGNTRNNAHFGGTGQVRPARDKISTIKETYC